MSYKILGISGSPVKKGNVDAFLRSIMDLALGKGLEAETISLSKMVIRNCNHCNFCLSHLFAFITLDMIPATVHACISPLGASAVASRHGEGKFDRSVRIGIHDDQAGLESARAHLSRALELVALINGTNGVTSGPHDKETGCHRSDRNRSTPRRNSSARQSTC